MKVYVLLIENKLIDTCYTSLKPLCRDYKLPYYGATPNKWVFLKDGVKYELKELKLNKILGRGNSNW